MRVTSNLLFIVEPSGFESSTVGLLEPCDESAFYQSGVAVIHADTSVSNLSSE